MNPALNHHATVEVEAPPARHDRAGAGHSFPVEHPTHPATTTEPARTQPGPRKTRAGRSLFIGIVVAVAIVALILFQRSRSYRALAAATAEMAVPTVATTLSQPAPADAEIQLPGNLMAFTDAAIYARANGYLTAWYTDIGAKLKAGQLMAEITAPDMDARLRQSTADLARARAALDIDQLNFQRSTQLLATRVISQQEFDQNRTNLDAAQAAVRAGEANVQDLTVEQGFQKITAPFDGVVTQRNTDVGALINAGSTAGKAQELFHVARTDILRVYVSVPEIYSPLIKPGMSAWLDLAEYPGVKFLGKVADVAGAIDQTTRTLQTEIQVPNQDGRLYPGAYAMVHLVLKLENPPNVVPINTLLFRAQGMQVAVVDNNDIVHLKNVTVGRDFGTSLEITDGIQKTDRLILNPSDSIADGTKVNVQDAPPSGTAR
jgi:RND family efflux transporter MFP subunit